MSHKDIKLSLIAWLIYGVCCALLGMVISLYANTLWVGNGQDEMMRQAVAVLMIATGG